MIIMLSILGALVLTAAPTRAQDVVGNATGQIVTTGNVPLPGALVTVASPSLIGTRSTVTDSSGRFTFLSLPVGIYEFSIRRPGFRPLTIPDVHVRLSATANLTKRVVERADAVQLPERVVTAADAGFESRSVAARTTLDARQLDGLPVERNARALGILAPTATPSFYAGDEVNVGGATGLENIWFIDGINITSPINGATSTDLPYNFIRQVEIRTSAAEADATNALGGVMNVVTPSGGNTFEGEFYGFFTGGVLQGNPRTVPGSTAYDTRRLTDAGINFSGPLVKDRLWFFAAYNPTFSQRDVRFGASSPLASIQRQHLVAAKLSGIFGTRTTGSLTLIGDPTDEELVAPAIPIFGQPATVSDPRVVSGSGGRRGVNVAARLLHQFSPNFQVEVSQALSARRESIVPRSPDGEPAYIDYVTGDWSGGFGYNQDIRSTRSTSRAVVSLQLPRHFLRFGAEYDRQSIDATQLASANSGGGFLQRVDSSYYIWFQFEANGRLVNRNPGFFARDSWDITPFLTLNAGFRWSTQRLGAQHTLHHTVADGLQPQLSAVYRPNDGDRRVFASYARVADQLALWFGNQYGPGLQRVVGYEQDPRVDTTGATCLQCFSQSAPPYGLNVDSPLRGVIQDEWSVGYAARVLEDYEFAIRGIRRELQSIIDDGFVVAGPDGAFVVGNPGWGKLAGFPRATRRYDALELTLERRPDSKHWMSGSYVLSRTRGNYTGLYTTELTAGTPHVSAQFDYPEQLTRGTGLLPNDRTHTFKLNASTVVREHLSLGASVLVASGTALSEYGTISVGAPYWSFITPRGTAGRTPTLWDAGFRLRYNLAARGRWHPQIIIDVLHIGSPRRPVTMDQTHYTALDEDGGQTGVNPNYGRVTGYQPPMMVRVGTRVRY